MVWAIACWHKRKYQTNSCWCPKDRCSRSVVATSTGKLTARYVLGSRQRTKARFGGGAAIVYGWRPLFKRPYRSWLPVQKGPLNKCQIYISQTECTVLQSRYRQRLYFVAGTASRCWPTTYMDSYWMHYLAPVYARDKVHSYCAYA